MPNYHLMKTTLNTFYLKPGLKFCSIRLETGFAASYDSPGLEDPISSGNKTDW